MERARFFDAIRPAFGGSFSQEQVTGIEAILDSCKRNNVTNQHHVAFVLSNVRRETGGYMFPIKETVYPHHKNKHPTDAEVKSRLERAWKAGKLSWVKTPYWRDGGFGRGQIQLSHWSNYTAMGKRLDVDLRGNPDLALDPQISADIAVVGMKEGRFTGRSLKNYKFPEALENEPADHPRRIVNGKDGSDGEINKYHRMFYAALEAAGFGKAAQKPTQRPKPTPAPSQPKPAPSKPKGSGKSIIGLILAAAVIAAAMFSGIGEFLQSIIQQITGG